MTSEIIMSLFEVVKHISMTLQSLKCELFIAFKVRLTVSIL